MKAKFKNRLEIEKQDLIEFNKELKNKEVDYLEFDYFNFNVKVDLTNQEIFFNEKKIDLELDGKLNDIRWINFRRNIISYQMGGERKHSYSYGVGFQGELNGNVQRFILIDDKGYTLHKKR